MNTYLERPRKYDLVEAPPAAIEAARSLVGDRCRIEPVIEHRPASET